MTESWAGPGNNAILHPDPTLLVEDEVIVYETLILQTKLQTTEPSLYTRTCQHISRWTVLIVCDQLSEDFFVILPVAILKMQKPVRARPTTLNAIALLQRIKRS